MARVLVVDDDPDILRLLRLCLEEEGHEVVTTSRPREALDLMRANRPAAVVLDVMMPETTGWDVLASIREDPEMHQVPVVMLSALGEVENRVRGIRLGADDYLAKPFDPEELVVRLERIIARRTPAVSDLQGNLRAHAFSELVQSLSVTSKTGELEITAKGDGARLDFVEGRVVGARFGKLSGEEAFLALVELEDGKFSFTAKEKSSAGDRGNGESLQVQALLLHSAWLEDELKELGRFLPGVNEILEVCEPAPDFSEIADDVPVEKIFARLRSAPASLAELSKDCPFSRNHIRLSVAWLRKVEGVSVVATGPAAEKLNGAVRSFIEDSLSRGFPADGLRLGVLVAPGLWNRLAPVILSLPSRLLGTEAEAAKQRILQDQRGRLTLLHEAGQLAVEFQMLEVASDTGTSLEPGLAGVVLWAYRELDPDWVSRVEELAGPDTTVLLVASPALILAADGFPKGSKSWRWLTPVPETLSRVLQALSEDRR